MYLSVSSVLLDHLVILAAISAAMDLVHQEHKRKKREVGGHRYYTGFVENFDLHPNHLNIKTTSESSFVLSLVVKGVE